MNSNILYILFVLFFITACGGAKEVATNATPVSSKDYPYIESFHMGVRLKAKGRVEEAIEVFNKCLLIRQDDDAVYFALSALELMRNNEEAASNYILKAAEIDPDNIWYTQELAYMYFKQQDFPKAVEQFKQLTENEPRNVEWQYGYAEALVKSGEVPRAIEALNTTEDQVGINPQLSIQKYSLYMSVDQMESAVKEIELARESYPKDAQLIATLVDHYFDQGQNDKAVVMLEALVKTDPQNGRAHLALADVYRQEGKKKEAYDALKKAFLSPDVTVDNKMRILININESSVNIDDEVYELVDIMVEQYPTEAKAHSINADFLLGAGKDEEALTAYKKALQYDENQYPIWKQVLIMEYQTGEYEDLYKDSKACLELFPTITTVYLLNGVAANQMNRHDEAIDVLSVGYELIINDIPMEAEFCGQLGDAYFGIKDYNEGKKSYKKALEIDPRSLLLKNNYAFSLAKHRIDLDLAESLINQTLAGAPGQAQFMDTHGFVLFQKGDYRGALEIFEKAYEANSEDAKIAEHLGDAYFKISNLDKALKSWKKAKEIKSNDLLEKKLKDKKYYAPE